VGAIAKSWQKTKLPLFLFFVLLFVGACGHHCQVLTQFGSPPFFGYFRAQLGTITKYQQMGSFDFPFFLFLLLLLV
jgi:hypothetical protein